MPAGRGFLFHPLPDTPMTTRIGTRLARISTLGLLLLAAGCGGDSPEAMLASARTYLEKNDPAAAGIQLKNALAKNPKLAEARFLLGRALLDSGDAVAAEVELRKAIELGFDARQANPVLAQALLARGQFKKVLDELAKATTASAEGLADLKTSIGNAHAMQGELDPARAAFNEAVAAKADHVPALLGLARLAAQQDGQGLPRAMAIVDDALAKAPRNAEAWQFKADLLRAGNDMPAAIAAYRTAVDIKPLLIPARAALIMIHLRDRELALAGEQLDALRKAAPKQALTLYMAALVAFGRKDLPAARTAMEALLKVHPDGPLGLQLAGTIAYESGSDVQAQEYLAKALQKAPGLDFGRRILVLSQLRSGQPAKALITLHPVLQGGRVDATWLALAGDTHMHLGDAKTAQDYFARAAKTSPDNSRIQTALALTRLRTGQTDQAFADLDRIAAADSGTAADMALIASSLRQKRFDQALIAIARFEKKQPDNPAAPHLRGTALLAKGDRAGARQGFEKALALNGAYLPAAGSLAQMDMTDNKPDLARGRFESVLAKDPKNIQALLALADLRSRAGETPDALAGLIAKAIAIAPAEPAPRLALINLHLRAQDNKKAVAAVQDALAAAPDRPEILDVAGQVFQRTGDPQQALAAYVKLAKLMPTTIQPYLRMADIQAATGNKGAARDSLARGLALQPDSLPMQRALTMLDVADGHFPQALARARDIQKARPKEVVGHGIEGDIHVAQKDWARAQAAYRAGLALAPTTDLAMRLHVALTLGEQPPEADRFAVSWIKAHPKDLAFRQFLANSANQRKDYATAVAHWRAMLAIEPENPALLNNLAWSLGQIGDPQAMTVAEKALKLAPQQPAIMDTLGMLKINQGDFKPGLDLLAAAVAAAPQAADIRLNYAKALIKSGQKSAAKQHLEILSRLGSQFPHQATVSDLGKGL